MHKYLSFQALFTTFLLYRKAKQKWSHHYHQSALTFSCVQHDQDFTHNPDQDFTHREKLKPHFEWQLPRMYKTTLNKDHCKNKYSFSLQNPVDFFHHFLPYRLHTTLIHWFQLRESFLNGVLFEDAFSAFFLSKPYYLQSHLCLQIHLSCGRSMYPIQSLCGIVFCCYCFSI